MAECNTGNFDIVTKKEEMAECIDEVDIDAIIKEVMAECGLSPDAIPAETPFNKSSFMRNYRKGKRSRRYYCGWASGHFTCNQVHCGHTWPSRYAWCVIDLKEQKLVMKLKQGCRKKHRQKEDDEDSNNPDDDPEDDKLLLDSPKSAREDDADSEEFPGVFPCYKDEKSVRRMVRWAVKCYMDTNEKGSGKREKRPPHMRRYCEMCKILRRRCC